MNGHIWLVSPVIVLSFAIAALAQDVESVHPVNSGLVLWYRQPARQWNAALPIGNGRSL